MTFDDAAFIVTGQEYYADTGWEQQQASEERQQFEENLLELTDRINTHLASIECVVAEMKRLQAVVLRKVMTNGHIEMQGGHDHEL